MQVALMKERPHGETEAALSSTLAVASVGIATLQMLETLLPAAAQEVATRSLGHRLGGIRGGWGYVEGCLRLGCRRHAEFHFGVHNDSPGGRMSLKKFVAKGLGLR